jgi:anti-anti-sigma factor
MVDLIHRELDSPGDTFDTFRSSGSLLGLDTRSEPSRTSSFDRRDESAPRDSRVQVLVCPGPRFGGATAARFAHYAVVHCRANRDVVLDLSDVSAVDAAGLLAVSSLARACRAAGGTLRLCSPSPSVLRLLATVGVYHLADVHPTRRHANLG